MGAVELVYTVIRQGILDGTYEQGARLGEVELAMSLEVSRTPVREALRRLLSDGLIESIPNHGSRVRRWDPTQLVEVFSVRALLEANSAALAAARVTDDDMAAMTKVCKQMESAARPGPRRDLEKVAALEAEIDGLEARLWDEALSLGPVESHRLATEKGEKRRALDALVEEWARLSEEEASREPSRAS